MTKSNWGIFSLDNLTESSIARFFDEERCREWILNKLYPQGPCCPKCKVKIKSEISIKRFWSGERLCCIQCGSFFNALTGTYYSGTNLCFREIYVLALLIHLKRDTKTISKCLHLSQKTVRHWRDKFEAMECLNHVGKQISERIENYD